MSAPVNKIDWEFDTFREAWTWRPNNKQARIRDVRNTLSLLFEGSKRRKLDWVFFPEYSIPKEAHQQIDFQHIADENFTVVIPGSYFNDDPESLHFRRNISRIYRPKKEVLVIGKLNAAPAESGLIPAGDLPNVARFVWAPTEQEPASISVFLGRDYLAPFAHQLDPSTGSRVIRHMSVLDWDREGINVVIMDNQRSSMFVGAAASDVSEIHGKRKAVLLVNCAQSGSDLGTALLVASQHRERAGVVVSLPPEINGILLFEVRLWDVIFGTANFATKETQPVKQIEQCSLNLSTAASLTPLAPQAQNEPPKRGIWHPAFLEVLRKIIVLDFYVGKTLPGAAVIFKKGHIRHVKAGLVRGVQDIMIQRYVARYLQASGGVPLSLPFSYLGDEEQRQIFQSGEGSPHLQVIIHPDKILKYRGAPIPQGEAWKKAHDAIKEIVVVTGLDEIISAACKLARKLDDDASQQGIPAELAPIFCLPPETDPIAIGAQHGNRESYILIRAPRPEGDARPLERFRQQVVQTMLMNDRRVRGIFEVDSKPQNFHYMLQLKCTSHDTDDILWKLHSWAYENKADFGTRTYEIWQHLIRDSIEGIPHTNMEEFEWEFLVEVKRVAGDIKSWFC